MKSLLSYPLKSVYLPIYLTVAFFALLLIVNPYIVVDLTTYSFDDGTYSHAYLIPFIVIYLIYESIQKGHLVVRFNGWFLLLSLCSLIALLLLGISQSTYLIRVLLPATYILLLLSVIKAHRDIIIAGSLMWFVTPVWGVLNGILQTISTIAVDNIMKLTGIPVYVEGNFVQIPAGVFEIAGGCSGLRYMITALALSLIYCHINLSKTRNIILIFGLAILGSMITNWIRIFIIILIGHYTEMQSSLVEDHNSIGWFVFAPFALLLFYVGGKLEAATALPQNAKVRGYLTTKQLVMVVLPVSLVSMTALDLVDDRRLASYAQIPLEQPLQSSTLPEISPQVFAYSSLEKKTMDDGVGYLFTFNGDNDANKPDFYLNDLIPENWSRLSLSLQEDKGTLLVMSHQGEYGKIKYQLVSGGRRTGSYTTYRVNRLLSALTFNRESQLYWIFERCGKECVEN